MVIKCHDYIYKKDIKRITTIILYDNLWDNQNIERNVSLNTKIKVIERERENENMI